MDFVSAPVAFLTHERYLDHDPGSWHPECPDRLRAVWKGIDDADLGDAIERIVPRAANRTELLRVHDAGLVDALERFCAEGGGDIDQDTSVVRASWDAAVLAAGAGLTAIEAIDSGRHQRAFCAVRPPGHHATDRKSTRLNSSHGKLSRMPSSA